MRTAAAQLESIGMPKELSPLRRKDIDTGARLERQRIVAWLRGDQEPYPDAHDIADEIEAGKHLV